MKRQLTKVIGTSVIALSMALPFSVPASAQTTTDPGATTAPGTTTDTRTYTDDGFDWGWLGLLGLLGLAGLAGRKRHEEPTRYRDPNAVGSTGYRE
ncbi:MAG: WGxxGxxG-CTERM domain-containing protein [Scytonema sp. RU_4_4]|nr:WGxxGxxG-CTERM domain-containing protein [Scytonema sp. RU_4_4]NJR73872.1 WGxxGxxG-CTERM domain-containing protein [Scytonema sp. CRU_2_7]